MAGATATTSTPTSQRRARVLAASEAIRAGYASPRSFCWVECFLVVFVSLLFNSMGPNPSNWASAEAAIWGRTGVGTEDPEHNGRMPLAAIHSCSPSRKPADKLENLNPA